jgi:glycosyltransferase involved in cell wall biosynthesis
VNKRSASASHRRVLLDARPLQGPDAQRGIGSYVRGLIAGLRDEGFADRTALLFDAGLPLPRVPGGDFVAFTVRRRYHGRSGTIEESVVMGDDLARIRPALYHATTLALPGRSPVPVLATVHDLIPWAVRSWRMLGERSRWALAPRLLRRADLVLTPSEATAADARRLAGVREERIRVVPEGVAAGFRPADGAAGRVSQRHGIRKPYLLFVGALDARKSPMALLRGWQVAMAAGADVELVLAGPSSRQAPADMGPARRLGYLDLPALVDLYSAAACLLFPSRYEGFGLPLLEAMACGCPVVAYRNSSLPEVAGDAGLLVPDGDADALGRAAAEVVLGAELASRLRGAGLARAAGFSWRRAARRTIAIYRPFLGAVRDGAAAQAPGRGPDAQRG